MKTLRPLPLVLLALVTTVAACVSVADETTLTTQVSSTTTQTTEAATLPDGTYFGFVRGVEQTALVFDPAEWFGNEEADAAARADGVIGPTENMPNPFYIRNPVEDNLRLEVTPGAGFTLLAYDDTGAPTVEKSVTYAELAQLWTTSEQGDIFFSETSWDEFGLPVHLTIFAGKVAGGTEQYIP
jgi:hypothetical protein